MIEEKALVAKFKAVGLELKILDAPIGRGNRQIFQLDIKRDAKGTHRREWYVCWPGTADGVEAQVMDVDKKKCQLLLMIKEGKAKFVRYKVRMESVQTMRGKLPKGVKIIKKHPNGSVDIQEETTGKTRKYLIGRDERMLFMCEVASSVINMPDALKALKGGVVTTAEGKHMDVKRQGEWFMIPATKAETKAIEATLKSDPSRLRKNVDVSILVEGGRGVHKPHVASEAVTVPPPVATEGYKYSVRGRDDVFIRGTVRHEDHPTKRLPVGVWHKVIRNSEVRSVATSGGMFRGSTYID